MDENLCRSVGSDPVKVLDLANIGQLEDHFMWNFDIRNENIKRGNEGKRLFRAIDCLST